MKANLTGVPKVDMESKSLKMGTNMMEIILIISLMELASTFGRTDPCMKGSLSMESEKVMENGYQIFTVKITTNMKENIMKTRKMGWECINGLMGQNTKECLRTI